MEAYVVAERIRTGLLDDGEVAEPELPGEPEEPDYSVAESSTK
jgi:hypothetical protein